ncbi:MAG: Nif3-like dinuclear metal center hexameric protein [Legionellales bacterium]|nr:Nif3-like dinuclear metal center hexameric protein [Legionellales bacterium]
MNINEIVEYIEKYLDVPIFKDYCHNGLQVQGKSTISNVVTGVSANFELLQKAVELNADAVIVHHGLFWNSDSYQLIGPKYNRVKILIENEINLLAYHLPLDAHKEIGNNSSLGNLLGVENARQYTVSNTPGIVWAGNINPISGIDFSQKLSNVLHQEPIHIESNPDREIVKIAWCTGAGQDFLEQAAAFEIDAFITGEISERTVHLAKELNIDFFAAGHHATEIFGVKNLGEHLSSKYKLNHTFCNIPNPI